MSDDKTTIRIPDADFKEAKAKKEAAGQTWAEYLTDDARGQPDIDDVARELGIALELDEGGMVWEDVKNACKEAIREELTATEMGGKQ